MDAILRAERDKAKADKTLAAVLRPIHGRACQVEAKGQYRSRVPADCQALRHASRWASSHQRHKRQDIAKLHHELASKPYQANRTLALLSKFFNWAEKHGLRPDGSNPCRHIEKYREGRRERFLSQFELARLGDALREAAER